MISSSARTKLLRGSVALVALAAAVVTSAQQAPRSPLDLPADATALASSDPAVRKANAIVNGHVLTQTDIDQRVALTIAASDGQIPANEIENLKLQVFRNLIDETLQIQAAKAAEITVTPAEIDQYEKRFAANFKQTPAQFDGYLRSVGSSAASIRRQIEGELAWRKLQGRKIESTISVGDEEVQAIIDKLNASKGKQEYRVGEIFLAYTPENAGEVMANANRIAEQLRAGGSFAGYARQYSQSSTAAVGGDLGWVRPEQLPEPLAAAAQALPAGQISAPIPVGGGVSIIAVVDSRQVLTANPKDAALSLKQLTMKFPPGSTQASVTPMVEAFAKASQNIGGCGGADAVAANMKLEVALNDSLRVRDLPAGLQDTMIKMNIGEATRPFGTVEEGVRILVLCGRDDAREASAPSFDRIHAQLNDERVNRRAQRYLRDLRRDAVVDYR